MYNYKTAAESSVAFWQAQPTDNPGSVNGFSGTWAISDHSLIPSALQDYIAETFYGYTRLTRIPLEDINNALNEVWEGPGSMAKITELVYEKRQARQEGRDDEKDPLKGYDTPTVDSQLTVVDNVDE